MARYVDLPPDFVIEGDSNISGMKELPEGFVLEKGSPLDNKAYGIFNHTPREMGNSAADLGLFVGKKAANIGIGAAKGLQDVGGTIKRGVAGLYDSALGTDLGGDVDAENKLLNSEFNKNYGEVPEANFGRISGNIVGTLPTTAINPFGKIKYIGQILNGAAQGAAAAGLTSSANDTPLSEQMASGGIVGGATQGAINLLSPVAATIARSVQPFTKAGIDKIAAKLISANSDNPTAIPNAIRNSPNFVPDSTPTVAQASQGSGDYGINSLEKGIKNIVPDAFRRKAAEQGMAQNRAFEGMMPQGTVEQLKAAREAATSPLYEKAGDFPFNKKLLDPLLVELENEAIKQGVSNKVGASLMELKNQIADNASGPNSLPLINSYKLIRSELAKKMGQEGAMTAPIKGVINPANKKFGQLLAQNNPDLAQADTAYANLSKPINQKQLLQEIQQKIQNPESNYLTDESTMSLSKLATQMRNMAPEIQKDLTPAQQAGLGSLRDDLNRISSTESANVKGVSQQSLSNLGTKNILNSLGKNKRVTTAIMDMPIISKMGGWAYGARDPVIQERLAELLANPQKMNTADLIEKASKMSGITPRQRGVIVNLLVHGNRGLQGNPNN